jgi:hypothetical protein
MKEVVSKNTICLFLRFIEIERIKTYKIDVIDVINLFYTRIFQKN